MFYLFHNHHKVSGPYLACIWLVNNDWKTGKSKIQFINVVHGTCFDFFSQNYHDSTSNNDLPSCYHSKILDSEFPWSWCLGGNVHLNLSLTGPKFSGKKSRCECRNIFSGTYDIPFLYKTEECFPRHLCVDVACCSESFHITTQRLAMHFVQDEWGCLEVRVC